MSEKKRILTGDRPTGKLHLGHYVGSLQNRVKLQDEYETLILIADIQALTTHFERPELIRDSIYQITMDNLSVGLDPEKMHFVHQSHVPALAELTMYFSMLVSMNTLRHNPTVKSEAQNYGYDDMTYGFFGYPVSQTSDITAFGAHVVPVGEDQLPHMELTRKLVRRFNDMYGEVFVEPQHMLSTCSRLMGLDGNAKMGKSLGNAIYLADTKEEVERKVKTAVTDPNRINLKDKGNPEICVVNKYHKIFTADEHENICDMCKNAQIGCVACKKRLAQSLNDLLDPFREKRAYYEAHLDQVKEIIESGTDYANKIANDTAYRAREAMHLNV